MASSARSTPALPPQSCRPRARRRGVAATAVAFGLLVSALLPTLLSGRPLGAQEAELSAARERAREAAAALTAADTELDQLEVDIDHAQRRLETLRASYDQVAEAVRAHLVDRYVQAGGTAPLVAEDLNVQARADALSRLATRRAGDRSGELRALRQQLDGQLRDLRNREKTAAQVRADRAAAQTELYAELERLEELDARRKEEERQAEIARRQSAAAAEAAEASSSSQASSGGGGSAPSYRPIVPANWLCPVTGGYAYDDTWGASRSGGRWHRGTDMFADYGTPVVAVVGGTAVDYGWDWAGGNGVFVLGDDGNRYYYAHLQEFGNLGRVEQGDVVGYVGDTGNATGTPHLHFEIHPGGSGWTNPYPTLIRYC